MATMEQWLTFLIGLVLGLFAGVLIGASIIEFIRQYWLALAVGAIGVLGLVAMYAVTSIGKKGN